MIICARKEDLIHKAGVYKITNIETRKFYIGSSKNLWKRYAQHKSDLKLNKHHNKDFQNDYNIYGLNSFKFEVIEYCYEDIRKDREQIYITLYKDDNKLYNKSTNAYTNNCNKDDEVKKKISKANKGKNNGMYGRTGELCPMYGKHHTDETKKKLSEINKGKFAGERNPSYGRTGELNYNAKTTYMYDENGNLINSFGCLKDCVRYLLDNKIVFSKAKNPIDSISSNVKRAIKNNRLYKGYMFSYIMLADM